MPRTGGQAFRGLSLAGNFIKTEWGSNMGFLGQDKEQDERLEALEEWLQGLTGLVQKQQVETAELKLDLIKLRLRLDEKLGEEDFDPAIMKLSTLLTEARGKAEEAAAAAEESWLKLQQNAADSLEELNAELEAAARRVDSDD